MHKLIMLIIVGIFTVNTSSAEQIHQWGVFEKALESNNNYDDNVQDIMLSVEFTGPAGTTIHRDGFWDGGRTWRVRYSPDKTGEWSWRSICRDDNSLDGQSGTFNCTEYTGSNPFYSHGSVRISDNQRHFAHADGTPLFWLVDTVWNGALMSDKQDWDRFLANRVSKKFTGIQFVMTQWRTAETDAQGQVAYTGYEKIEINPAFFQRMDTRISAINAHGLLAVPVMLWTLGGKMQSPGQLPEDQAIRLARYMTARYGAYQVVWFLPGDGNYSGSNAERWKRIGRAVFDSKDHAPVFLHPGGMQWPYDAFTNETWLSAHGYQSGHGDDANTLRWIHSGPPSLKWSQEPIRPVINLEPPYEDHIAYQSRQRHTAYTVRRASYWSLLNAPTAGVSYGAHGVWSWETEPKEPQAHGGTGVAQPWYKAMNLPGSTNMKHMAELFTSIPWWELQPNDALLKIPETESFSLEEKLTHVVYTRDNTGQACLYIDGTEQASRMIDGDLSNWESDQRLSLANELTADRPWLGEFHYVAIYGSALSQREVRENYQSGTEKGRITPLALYTFLEGEGDTVRDVSSSGNPLNLNIDKMEAVEWIPDGGLIVKSPVLISSANPAEKIINTCKKENAITVEAWIKPANTVQAGPARIVSISENSNSRNFTLGQDGDLCEMRLRTTSTSSNGIPSLSPIDEESARHISSASSKNGDVAVIYTPVGGEITINPGVLNKRCTGEWFNTRTGERFPAEKAQSDVYHTPDDQDWVLLFKSN